MDQRARALREDQSRRASRRAKLVARLDRLKADTLAAFDDNAPMMGSVTLYAGRDGLRASVVVDPLTQARREARELAAESDRLSGNAGAA